MKIPHTKANSLKKKKRSSPFIRRKKRAVRQQLKEIVL